MVPMASAALSNAAASAPAPKITARELAKVAFITRGGRNHLARSSEEVDTPSGQAIHRTHDLDLAVLFQAS
jgi:hypothetical protein